MLAQLVAMPTVCWLNCLQLVLLQFHLPVQQALLSWMRLQTVVFHRHPREVRLLPLLRHLVVFLHLLLVLRLQVSHGFLLFHLPWPAWRDLLDVCHFLARMLFRHAFCLCRRHIQVDRDCDWGHLRVLF